MLYLPPDPRPGEPIPADSIRAILKYLRHTTLRSCATFAVQAGAGGTTIQAKRPRPQPGVPPGAQAPFQVTLRVEPGSGPGAAPNQASVFWNSSLLRSLVLHDTQAITGLADEPPPDGDGNPNWFTFVWGNDLIWIEITLDGSYNVTAAAIKSLGMGNTWNPADPPQEYGANNGPFECETQYDGLGNPYYVQYIARIAIFNSQTSTSPDESGHYPVINTQMLNQNLLMQGIAYGGANAFASEVSPTPVGIVMPLPYAGPFEST